MAEFFAVIDIQKFQKELRYDEVFVPTEDKDAFERISGIFNDSDCLRGRADCVNGQKVFVSNEKFVFECATIEDLQDNNLALMQAQLGAMQKFAVFVGSVFNTVVAPQGELPKHFKKCVAQTMQAFAKCFSVKPSLIAKESEVLVTLLRTKIAQGDQGFVNNALVQRLLDQYGHLN